MGEMTQKLMQTSLGAIMSAGEATALVEKATTQAVHTGTTLFATGDPGDALYIILEGTFDVVLGQAGANATVVATLGAGQVVGELEVMTQSLRVATLAATDEGTVLVLPAAQLEAMLADNQPAATKLVTYIAKTLARRLAAVNQRVVAKAPAPAQAEASESSEPVELSDDDLILVDDDDLDVLDKLWS